MKTADVNSNHIVVAILQKVRIIRLIIIFLLVITLLVIMLLVLKKNEFISRKYLYMSFSPSPGDHPFRMTTSYSF